MSELIDHHKISTIHEAKDIIKYAAQEKLKISFSEALEIIKISKLRDISESLILLSRDK